MTRPVAALLGSILWTAAASAAAPQWGGSIAVATDHMQRGVSRSGNDTAWSAELHAGAANGLHAGLWASTARVRPTDHTNVEVAATLGFSAPVARGWRLGATYTHYESPWNRVPDFYRYDELTIDLRLREVLQLSASYSPNTSRFGAAFGPVWRRDAFAYEASVQHALHPSLRAHAGLGYYDLSDLFGRGYWYGSAGLAFSRGRWQLDATWVATGADAERQFYRGAGGQRALLALRLAF